jgi:hypothetical protein
MIDYSRKNILSMKLQGTMLRRLTHKEMLTRLQIVRTLEPVVNRAFEISEQKRYEEQEGDDPHGQPWHVSFHASKFPGNDPMACPREALYTMMDLPRGVFSRRSRMLMNIGKQVELDIVRAFDDAGMLLSASIDHKVQTSFKAKDQWLTGSVDCVIRRHDAPLPIEIKTKDRQTVLDMRLGKCGPDDAHVKQLKTQLGMIYVAQSLCEIWDNLEMVSHGYIYYVSRGDEKNEREVLTAEFRVDLDKKFFEVGLARLAEWRGWFEDNVLPELNPGKRDSKFGHPNGWRWSYLPCAWCDHKKTCQEDFRAGVIELEKSVGIPRARKIRENYSYEKARQRVFSFWEEQQRI